MMLKKKFVWLSIVTLLLVLSQATRTLAVSTTGVLTGYVLLQSGAPLAGAKVTAVSPSQSATTTTDASGHFEFLTLNPDTYTVTASKDGYDTVRVEGVTVIANSSANVTLRTEQTGIKTLGVVTTRSAGALVRPGTTADVYSVSPTVQEKVASLGGGGSLSQAYSAIATTPGAVVPPGGYGWFQTVYIRGGDYDQIGYEFDGVPVLREYDNYPSVTASTLGQQELQVYTGAPPATAQSQGLAGFINQVVKSGTYPGFSNLTLGIGAPSMANSYTFEVGGATPDRNFSYYLGSSVSSAEPRPLDNFNGASQSGLWGSPVALAPCPGGATAANFASCYASGIGPGGYVLGPYQAGALAQVEDRENLVNLHFAIPNGTGKDDVQLLYDVSYLNNFYYMSASDWGFSSPGIQAAYGAPAFPYVAGNLGLGYEYTGQVGAPLASNYQALTHPVYFPYNPASVGNGLLFIPFNQRDGTANPNSILKLQYQHNMGSNAYLRIYGYADYSEWPQTCPDGLASNYIADCPYNYYVSNHINGANLEYGNQLNDKNLLTVDLSDRFSIDYRANDLTMINQLVGLHKFAYVVNANNPTAGICYNASGQPVSCFSANALAFTLAAAASGAPLPTLPTTCGTGPCEWYVTEDGEYGGNNFTKPNFATASITDQIKAGSKLQLNIGVREDRFQYVESNTLCGGTAVVKGTCASAGAREFWFNAWNNSYCVVPGLGQVPFYNPNGDTAANAPCPGPPQVPVQTVPATLTNLPNFVQNYWVFQPRFGATYTANDDNVFRLSYGRVDQAPSTAFEQYNVFQQDLAKYDGLNFWPLGFTTTSHYIPPPTSQTVDLSWEHQFGGSEASFKLTPYWRQTNGQIQNFFLNQKTNFVSGLGVGQQTASGVEFALNLGNFNQNGLSALLSYTWTHAFIRYTPLATGDTALATVNVAIQQYNSFTKGCSGAVGNTSNYSPCGAFGGANAVPCFNTAGAPQPVCAAGDVSNPYYNAPLQSTLNPNAVYAPFDLIPGALESSADSYVYPQNATLVLNYKRDKWAFSPQLQFFQGTRYGAPLSTPGFNPSTCTAVLAGSVSGDPRYPYGGQGQPADATSCSGSIVIPNPYTGVFDTMGSFQNPNQLLLHAQLSYQASPRVTFQVFAANIVDTCFGGTKAPWTQYANHQVCSYGLPGYAPLTWAGNFYNPGATFQPIVKYPYMQYFGTAPFLANFQVKISL
jgi:hypothetical protein